MVRSRLLRSQMTILPSPPVVEMRSALFLSPLWIWMQEIWNEKKVFFVMIIGFICWEK